MNPALRAVAFGAATAAIIASTGCDAAPPAQSDRANSTQAAPLGSGDLSYERIRELVANPDGYARARDLATLLPTLGPGSVPAVKRALDDAAALEMGATEFELLMRYWATHAPADAGSYALAVAPRGYRVAAIYAAVVPWAIANPQEALETVAFWAREGGDGGAAAETALVRGWYLSGKPGLEDYIRDLGAGISRQRALSAYAVAVIRKRGANAIVEWVESLPEDRDDETYQREALRNVAGALVPFDLAAAKRFCDTHCEGPGGSDLRAEIAGRWALADAPAALEWLGSSPESQTRAFAIRVTYASWGNRDRAAAVRWMREKTAGEPPAWLEPAQPIYARLLGKESPTEGLAWAARLAAEDERKFATIDIARYWRHRDEVAAEAWLAQSPLSPEILDKIREPETELERRLRLRPSTTR
jgi:hypothetical protein